MRRSDRGRGHFQTVDEPGVSHADGSAVAAFIDSDCGASGRRGSRARRGVEGGSWLWWVWRAWCEFRCCVEDGGKTWGPTNVFDR